MRRPSVPRTLALLILLVAVERAWTFDACDAPPETWQPRKAVQALAERNGWQVHRLKVDHGCYEVKGRDAEGRRFKARIDPATLQVVRLRREDDGPERAREGRRAPG